MKLQHETSKHGEDNVAYEHTQISDCELWG